jgi:hypothetical protein
MNYLKRILSLFSNPPKHWVKVEIDETYYLWLDKIMTYAPESESFFFRQLIITIQQDDSKMKVILSAGESLQNPSKFTAEDIFYTLFADEFLCLAQQDWPVDVVDGHYRLTDKGRSLKQVGSWREWHRIRNPHS